MTMASGVLYHGSGRQKRKIAMSVDTTSFPWILGVSQVLHASTGKCGKYVCFGNEFHSDKLCLFVFAVSVGARILGQGHMGLPQGESERG